MEVKKCARCGSFYASEANTCELCLGKDRADVRKIKSYFAENENAISINELAVGTNITEKNITRLIANNELTGLNIKSML